MKNKSKKVSLMLRLPYDLHREIVRTADKEERSLNKHVIFLLREKLNIPHEPGKEKGKK